MYMWWWWFFVCVWGGGGLLFDAGFFCFAVLASYDCKLIS